MKKCLILIFALFFMTSCISFKDLLKQDSISPDKIADHKPEGALVFGTVENTENHVALNSFIAMVDKGPDLMLYLNDKLVPFLIDVPTNSAGFSKIGLRYSNQGDSKDQWFNKKFRFALNTSSTIFLTNVNTIITTKLITNTAVTVTNNIVEVTPFYKINYIGRFVINVKNFFSVDTYTLQVTNMFSQDRERFLKLYPSMSNSEFVYSEVTVE